MYEDTWRVVILFLEPMDVICSFSNVCHSFHRISLQLVCTDCDDPMECWEVSGKKPKCQLSYGRDTNRDHAYLVMKNKDWFVKMYLRRLALKLDECLSVGKDWSSCMSVIDQKCTQDLEEFQNYKHMISKKQVKEEEPIVEKESEETSFFSYIASWFKWESKKEPSCDKTKIVKCFMVGESVPLLRGYFETFLRGQVYTRIPSIPMDFQTRQIDLLDERYSIQLWETTFLKYHKEYSMEKCMSDTSCLFICFSANDWSSFENVKSKWDTYVHHSLPNTCQVVLIGFSDLEGKKGIRKKAHHLAKQFNALYFEVHPKEIRNVYTPALFALLYKVFHTP